MEEHCSTATCRCQQQGSNSTEVLIILSKEGEAATKVLA